MLKSLKSMLSGMHLDQSRSNNYQYSNINPHTLFFELIKRWPEIVGEKLASHSIPLKNNKNILTILTDHPQWSQELSFLEQKIKYKIFKIFPTFRKEIQRIKFQADNQFFKKRNIRPSKQETPPSPPIPKEVSGLHKYSPEYKKLKKDADQIFTNIKDEETKELLTSIYITFKSSN